MYFTKGFNEIKERSIKSSLYTRSCESCQFYFKDEGDEEELCQNTSVLAYDICTEDTRVYCSFWQYVSK